MLSILIPSYNYNTYPLVEELKTQADNLKILYEIIIQDDCSNQYIDENSKINLLENCFYFYNIENLGRTQNRTILANRAKFDLLLFLDADVFPEKKTFLKDYLKAYSNDTTIFGGYKYHETNTNKEVILRYVYGKKREEKPASIRNKSPYSFVFSGNVLIDKSIFLKNNFNGNKNIYGMDNFFAYNLFKNNHQILHIDNPIFHNGLENNSIFFQKSLKSIESRQEFLTDNENIGKINSLLKHYFFLKKLNLTRLVGLIFKFFDKPLQKCFLNENPNLFCFDLYRLGYLCSLKSK